MELILEAGGITGTMRCKKCGYNGVLFPEKEVDIQLKKRRKK